MTDFLYLQRKANCYPNPMVELIGNVLAWHMEKVKSGISFRQVFAIYKEGVLYWYGDKPDIEKCQKESSDAVIEEPLMGERCRRKFESLCVEFNIFIEGLKRTNFEKISNEGIIKWYSDYCEKYEELYIWGEPFAWSTKDYLIEYLTNYLKDKPRDVLNTLISPVDITFTKREEIELLKIADKPELLDKQVSSFNWIPYDYGVMVWDRKHFEEELKNVNDPEKELKKIMDYYEELPKKQEQLEKDFDEKHKQIFKSVRDFAFLMDYKKETFTKSHLAIRPMLEEIAKRLKLPLELSQFLTINEVKKHLYEKSLPDKEKLQKRYENSVYINTKDGKYVLLEGKEATDFIAEAMKKEEIIADTLKGTPASRGKVQGKVRIILDAKKIDEMQQGEILVTAMTSPDYTAGMKKAAGIITDEGGLTCHAAIVSRELGIPCVISTKNATHILKTGDTVELDADNGVVKIL